MSLHLCDNCKNRIDGTRWKCSVCSDYDLCDHCYKAGPPFEPPHLESHSVKPFRGDEAEEELHSNVIAISSMAELKEAAKNPNYKLMVCNFFASWYKPSVIFFPIFAKMSREYPTAAFLRVDIDVAKDVASHYTLTAPAIKIFQKGKKTIDFAGVNVLAKPTELESMIGYELGRMGIQKVEPPPEEKEGDKENSEKQPTPAPISTSPKHFPAKEFLLWTSTGQLDKIFAKFIEFSSQLPPSLALTPLEISHVRSLVDIINNKADYNNSQVSADEFDSIKRVVMSWPFEKVFPALDLLRLVLIHPHGAYHFGQPSEISVFEYILQNTLSEQAGADNSKLVALRAICNLFSGTKETAMSLLGSPTNGLARLGPLALYNKKPNQIALAYLLLNYSIVLVSQSQNNPEHFTALLNIWSEMLTVQQDEESVYQILVGLGTVSVKCPVDKVKSVLQLIIQSQPIRDYPKCKQVVDEINTIILG